MYRVIKSISLRDTPMIIATVSPAVHCTETRESDMECKNKLQQAQSECDVLIAEAKKKAEQIIAKATADGDKLVEESQRLKDESQKLKEGAASQGHKEGYAAGVSEGIEAGKQQARQDMTEELSRSALQASQLLKAAEQDGRKMILDAEQQILSLSVAIARKILVREIDENPMVVLPIVRSALEKVRDQQDVTVRVHSLDYELVLQSRRDLQGIVGREQPILVQADDTVPQGSCLINTNNGIVDARLDTQLESLQNVLQEVYP